MNHSRKPGLPNRCLMASLICGLVLPSIDQLSTCAKTASAARRRNCLRLRVRQVCRPCPRGNNFVSEFRQGASPQQQDSVAWTPIFNGKSLAGWKSINFGGEGDVYVENEKLMLEFGNSLTGVTYTKDFPKLNYEVRLEAMQVDGIDFFCGLTFPVGQSHCSLIVGGWAGAVVGLSNIDDRDASQNETTRYMTFKNGVWYRIRVRVTADKIEAWIDDVKVIDQVITGRKISTRPEVDLSKPFGISSYDTRAALKNIEMRTLGEH